ncbi:MULTISPECIES: polyurethane esterase [Serratia]|uniref:polyurethane esterase n=1 Tax=Serratia TaxID=613 RepID=UPI001013CCC8|nr:MULTISPECIES: polyurethanase [Serratia]CAI0911471.1 Lipase precursor [Serratia ficaria]CAI1501086.1 Lipase precursor [Serratia ficaria]CAI1507513.1 Lipase precursor [Serratia ficaria]CAI1771012.1 Lipase precursor [Serratia ficaria]CAI2102013.1 Lipase precursor [Serratia ficaria]
MGIFNYQDRDEAESKALFSDAMAIATYAYHNIDNGFDQGYHQTGFGLGLPLTLVTALIGSTQSQGGLPGIPWNPDSEQAALAAVNKAGWSVIGAEQLGYGGKTDARGTYYGETLGYTTAQAEVLGKYDGDGNLTAIGISFRGTSGPRESLIADTIGDVINDLLAGFGPDGYADNYTLKAFGNLLGDVATFARANGLSGDDVLISGHSLGGLAVNSMAALSDANWGGFYSQSSYVAFASPTQYETGGKVINIGYENDPVFRALDGTTLTPASLGVHDAPQDSATNNIVNFNDHYASAAWNLLPFSILNVPTWLSHLPFFYQDGLMRVLNSEFYSLTEKDSTIVVSNLSDVTRGNTWVEDLNRNAETHSGPTFIIGSDGNDLIKGGTGNDYLEGRDGNDIFRDGGGYNIVSGGKGDNVLDTRQALKNTEVAYDGDRLYLRDAKGGITLADDIGTLRSKETSWLVLSKEVDHRVTDAGLKSDAGLKAYAASTNGGAGDDLLRAKDGDAWLFGKDGNDQLIGHAGGNLTFVGGSGDDVLSSAGGNNTFLFSGDFGSDRLVNFGASDKLVFIGTEGASSDIGDYVSQRDNDLVLAFGASQVTLVGVALDHFNADQVVLA